MKRVKGYKVFSPNFTCRDFKYEVGKTYTHEGEIKPCRAGFHFCKDLKDCFCYYAFSPKNKVAQVVALGEIIYEDNKAVTNKIKIIKELSWHEVLDLVNIGENNAGFGNTGNHNSGNCNSGGCNSGNYNSGNYNSGNCNSGNCNSGNYNSGNCNSGSKNTGDCNSGHWNSGNYNSGNYNSGNCNSGNCNSGSKNTGNWNSGNCNSGNYNSGNCNSGSKNTGDCNSGLFNSCNHANGLFNSKSPKIYMFNKPTKMTYESFQEKYSEAYKLLYHSSFRLNQWISGCVMSEEEKKAHPEYKTTGGYLKRKSYKEACKEMWKHFNKSEKDRIKALPNFDEEVFFEITGIKV